jgi:hypothetical protein
MIGDHSTAAAEIVPLAEIPRKIADAMRVE